MTKQVKNTKDRIVETRKRSASSSLSNVSSEAQPKHLETLPISKISTISASCFYVSKGFDERSISRDGNTLLMMASSSRARSYRTVMSYSRSMFGWFILRPRGEVRASPGIGPCGKACPET